jgi:hypothetical protein
MNTSTVRFMLVGMRKLSGSGVVVYSQSSEAMIKENESR